MKSIKIRGIILIVFIPLFVTPAWSENILNSDYDYSIKIAVTIEENENIMGKLEYSNHVPQFPIQLITFNSNSGRVHCELYVFELLEKKVISKKVHRIKCRSINNKYGSIEITGTIDFSKEIEPKIQLLTERGNIFISNISENGKKRHMEYIPNIWLGH